MSTLRENFGFQLLYVASQLVFPLLTYPYITRKLGAEGIGIVGYVESLTGAVAAVASIGIPMFGVREIARTMNQPAAQLRTLRQLSTLYFLASLVGCGFFIAVSTTNHNQELPLSLTALACASLLAPVFVADWYLQGIEAFRYVAVRNVVLRCVGLICLFLFVQQSSDFVTYYLVIVGTQCAVALATLFKTGLGGVKPWTAGFNLSWSSLLRFFFTTSIISVYVFFDGIILGWVAGERHVGYYTFAVKLVKLSLLLVLSLNAVLFPRISHLHKLGETAEAEKLVTRALDFLLLITVPLSAMFFCMAPEIVLLIAGPGFSESVLPLRILSALPLIIGLSNLFCYQVLVPYGRESDLLKCVAGCCICSFLLHVWLAPRGLESGTAVATLCTEALATVTMGYLARRILKVQFPWRLLVNSVLATLPLLLMAAVARYNAWPEFTSVVLVGIAGLAGYALLQFKVFKNKLLADLFLTTKAAVKSGIRG